MARGAARLTLVAAVYAAGCSGPSSIFQTHGSPGGAQSLIGWWITGVMSAVVIVTCALYLIGAARSHPATEAEAERAERERRGVRWVVIGGAVVPAAILTTIFGFTLASMRSMATPPGEPALTIRITGYQWWWKVAYLDRNGDEALTTANEIHLPVGEPVRLELESADVIHSFWIPELAGKIDLIPGRRNRSWIEADEPGTYRGQCAEFCGMSHANMRLRVVAERRPDFEQWMRMQRQPARPNPAGMMAFETAGCAACHRIRGTLAQGSVAPDLTHVGSRATLAAGLLTNTPENMADWLRAPDSVKAGAKMPDLELGRARIDTLVGFLQSLD